MKALSGNRLVFSVLLAGLFLSGIGAIVNQVVWQRALKIFLGGSETLSAMIVILVFMLGLGFGAVIAGQKTQKIRRPIIALALIEVLLFAVNLVIAWIFALDIRETVYSAQQLALSAGIPLRLVYGLGALLILALPTLLMGATIPLASEIVQRDLHYSESRIITVLFFLNTGGAAAGALGAGFVLLPYFGQTPALIFAAGCNLLSGFLLLWISRALNSDSVATDKPTSLRSMPLTHEEKLAFILGFLALGYEMHCLRMMSLAHGPLPYTFAVTLSAYLLTWSLGVYLASFTRERFLAYLWLLGLWILAMPGLYNMDRFEWNLNLFVAVVVFCLPCIFFGLLYGHLVARSAKRWGRDVGRFVAINTIGSCLGVVFFTLLGYELSLSKNSLVMVLLLASVSVFHLLSENRNSPPGARYGGYAFQGFVLLAIVMVVGIGLREPYTKGNYGIAFWGRDGVVEIDRQGNVYLDSLWHTKLSDGRSHIGGPWNWSMAAAGILAHKTGKIENALVVGFGVGLTATTLTLGRKIEVDSYEINQTLKDVLDRFPTETLQVTRNNRINIIWQDARSGLALNDRKYDLIISSPLELSQAGSTLLISQEYLRLLKSRLRENGVAVLYSREISKQQARLVRNTIASVFEYSQAISNGIITVASDSPVNINPNDILAMTRKNPGAPLNREIRAFLRADREAFFRRFRPVVYPPSENDLVIKDRHPLVEYPDVLEKILAGQ